MKRFTEETRPPRAFFLKWPMGHPLGEPFKLDKQKEVLKAALELLVTAKEPGVIVEPGWKWKRW